MSLLILMSLFIQNKCYFNENQTRTEAQKHARKPLTYNSSTACRALLDKHWLSRGGEHKARWMQQWRAEGFVAEWFSFTSFPTAFDIDKMYELEHRTRVWIKIHKTQKYQNTQYLISLSQDETETIETKMTCMSARVYLQHSDRIGDDQGVLHLVNLPLIKGPTEKTPAVNHCTRRATLKAFFECDHRSNSWDYHYCIISFIGF